MALTDIKVRNAKPTDKLYSITDSGGLSLVVFSSGRKFWHYRYYWLGKQKRLSLGSYPEQSLHEARSLRDEARTLLVKGANPCVHRKQQRQAACLAEEHTFQAIFNRWFEHRKLSLNAGRQSTLSQIERIFGKDVLPALGKRSIYEIQRLELIDVVARIERRGALSIAGKVRTWLRQMFRYAVVIAPGMQQNPASDLDVVAVPQLPVRHNPFLRLPELPGMLQVLRNYPGRLQTQLGLRLLLLTGVRTGELRWATPDQFDLDRGLWIIPSAVVKQLQLRLRKDRKRSEDVPAYLVPLSSQAVEIVKFMLEQCKPAQRYLFPHISCLRKRMSENTLNSALHRMGYGEQLTGHGIRGTISTALNEIGYPKVWIEAQLSHADRDKVSAAYNHAEYVDQRRAMMQDWANRLDLLETGELEAACTPLIININGTGVGAHPVRGVGDSQALSKTRVVAPPLLPRLSSVPEPVIAQPVSGLQRERLDRLAAYEAPHNLPVTHFARLAGKSRDQINREIKTGKLLAVSFGNRGQRIPEWQLDPVGQQLTKTLMTRLSGLDSWQIYRGLTRPQERLEGQNAIGAVSPSRLKEVIESTVSLLQMSD